MNGSASPRRIKVVGALIGASAVVALGALTSTMHQEQAGTGSNPAYSVAGGMTLATDVTTTIDEPMTLDTSKAVPPVKATPFGGSGS